MISLLAVLLAVGGVAAYFVLATQFAYWQRLPWQFMAVTAAGAMLGVGAFIASPGTGTGIAALTSAAVLASSVWYFLFYSQFGTREDRPGVGDVFPDFTLPDSTGGMFRLSEGASDYLWQWGQFLDHDLDLTDGTDPPEPADVPMPLGDPFFDPSTTPS